MPKVKALQDNGYDIHEHVHRFAVWAASRAASQQRARFTVEQGRAMIEKVELKKLLSGVSKLPTADCVDDWHREMREAVIQSAPRLYKNDFTQGIAAKLINVYLKAGLVTIANAQNKDVGVLHPPIDRELLNCLARQNYGGEAAFWRGKRDRGWTNFTSDEYQEVITKIREKLGNEKRLWMIEEHWP